jgi:2-iminoacetate synthase
LGRTGEQFMEFAIPGFIQNLCTPNALSTLMEYLIDYASPETRAAGQAAVSRELEKLPESERKRQLLDRLRRIVENNERDLYF